MKSYVLENESHFEHGELDKKCKLYKNVVSRFAQDEEVCVSLSGGVDSMVIMSILKEKCKCTALHINYKNREESDDEQAFLERWCEHYDIPLKVLTMKITRNGSDRNEYEKETNALRYTFYKQNSDTIILGHHRNDIVENVIANAMARKSLFDLHSMPYTSTIDGVTVKRPLIDNYKFEIMSFAMNHNIPYFKDTTPDWSVRGRLRNSLFKSFESIYKNYDLALYSLADECLEWKGIVHENIIEPMYESVFTNYPRSDDIYIPRNILERKPFAIWKRFFMYTLHKNGKSMIPNSSMSELFKKCSKPSFMGKVQLKKNLVCEAINGYLII